MVGYQEQLKRIFAKSSSVLTRRWNDIARSHTFHFVPGHTLRFARGRISYFDWGRTGCTASNHVAASTTSIWSNRRGKLHRGHLRGSVRRAHPYPVAQSYGESTASEPPRSGKTIGYVLELRRPRPISGIRVRKCGGQAPRSPSWSNIAWDPRSTSG